MSEPEAVDLVRHARELATQAHAGQTDKAGNAYIGHPARVAARCAGNPEAEAAAWLHDVVEDCGITLVVKLADLADNTDPERLAVLDEATRSRLEAK